MKFNYEIFGNKDDFTDTVVLLHGWGASIRSFSPIIKNLEGIEGLRIVAFDFPGFGDTMEPSDPWDIYRYADETESNLRELGIESPILLGHSFGGRVSMILASRIGIKKLVLVDAAGIKPKRPLKYYVKVYTYKLMKHIASLPGIKAIMKEFMEAYRSKAGSSDYNRATPLMRKVLSTVVNQDLRHHLRDIKAPSLLIWGENDTATPVSDAEIIKSLIPDSGLVVLKNAGHFSYLDKPTEFNTILNSFLQGE